MDNLVKILMDGRGYRAIMRVLPSTLASLDRFSLSKKGRPVSTLELGSSQCAGSDQPHIKNRKEYEYGAPLTVNGRFLAARYGITAHVLG